MDEKVRNVPLTRPGARHTFSKVLRPPAPDPRERRLGFFRSPFPLRQALQERSSLSRKSPVDEVE